MERVIRMETNNRRKALGRGLEQLFSNESLYVNPIEEVVENAKEEDIVEVKLSELRSNPYQPRQTFDQEKLVELAESIKEFGVLEPIIITKSIKGYEIVAGERRKKASELAGLETIPAIIKEFSDEEMMQIALLENIQREDLTAIEEAEAYSNLLKALNVTQDELAKKIGKSRSYITNMLGLLRLPEVVKNDILNGYISAGHAKILSKLEDDKQIISLVDTIKKDNISVRELESLVNNPNYKRKNKIVKIKQENKYNYVEDAFTDVIGNKVKIKNNKIVIPFNSEKDLERILELLNVEVKVD
jgi:ParB family chromosome partitioning protein